MSAVQIKVITDSFTIYPCTGKIFWKERPREYFKTDWSHRNWNNRFAGTEAFTTTHAKINGYKQSRVFGHNLLAHRVIFAFVHGYWPKEVDHIDGDRFNNKIENLRECTRSQNIHNIRRRNGKQLPKGVTKSKNRFRSRIHINGKYINLGFYATAEEAHNAYKIASIKYVGEFSNAI